MKESDFPVDPFLTGIPEQNTEKPTLAYIACSVEGCTKPAVWHGPASADLCREHHAATAQTAKAPEAAVTVYAAEAAALPVAQDALSRLDGRTGDLAAVAHALGRMTYLLASAEQGAQDFLRVSGERDRLEERQRKATSRTVKVLELLLRAEATPSFHEVQESPALAQVARLVKAALSGLRQPLDREPGPEQVDPTNREG